MTAISAAGHRGLPLTSSHLLPVFPHLCAAKPGLTPWVIPFNSAYDAHDTGYFGSKSRYMRSWLALQVWVGARARARGQGRCSCLWGRAAAGWRCSGA